MRTHPVNLSAVKKNTLISLLLLMSVCDQFKLHGRCLRTLCLEENSKMNEKGRKVLESSLTHKKKSVFSNSPRCRGATVRFPCEHLDLKLMQMIPKYCTGSYLFKQIVTECKSTAY